MRQGPRFPNWQAPTLLGSSVFAAVGFATAHHIFYQALDGNVVPAGGYRLGSLTVSHQQLGFAGGTALALLAKASMATAIGISYLQVCWWTVRGRATRLETLDVLFSGETSPWKLYLGAFAFVYPVLGVLAFVLLALPIASVITPATLSVALLPVKAPPVSLLNVPRAAFDSLAFIASSPGSSNDVGAYYNYAGPSTEVRTIAAMVAAEGRILAYDSPVRNASWQMSFQGPSLQCNYLDTSAMNSLFAINVQDAAETYYTKTGHGIYYSYIAAVSDDPSAAAGPIPGPFQNAETPSLGSALPEFVSADLGPLSVYLSDTDSTIIPLGNPASLYVAVTPEGVPHEGDVVRCHLWNATYTTSLSYADEQETVKVLSVEPHSPVAPVASYYALDLDTESPRISGANTEPNGVDQASLQRLSFQAVMEAFGSLVVGYISNTQGDGGPWSTQVRTQILETVLADSQQLASLHNSSSLSSVAAKDFNISISPLVQSLSPNSVSTISPGQGLSKVMEELFENITVSMWFSKSLRYAPGSPFEPPPVRVTSHVWENTYVYAARQLWSAYGTALAATVLAGAGGLFVMLHQHRSFGNKFSTVFRVSRSATLSVPLNTSESGGEDPLPRRLANASLTIGDLRGQAGGPRRRDTEYVEVSQLDTEERPVRRRRVMSMPGLPSRRTWN